MRSEIRNNTRTRRQSVFALAIISLVLLFGAVAQAATFHVTTTADNGDNNNPTPGSLRKAILDADANAGTDTIDFNITGAGVHTITMPVALPTITDPVVIDGYTQPGASPNTLASGDNAVLLIELDGSQIAGNFFGLFINAGGSTIKGLVINHFHSSGGGATAIGMSGKGNNVVAGNFIGTNASGTAKASSDFNIFISACSGNTIGGTTPAARNVISGSPNSGVYIAFAGATDNIVQGNYIGTDASGTAAIGNNAGVLIVDAGAASNNLVGGTQPGA